MISSPRSSAERTEVSFCEQLPDEYASGEIPWARRSTRQLTPITVARSFRPSGYVEVTADILFRVSESVKISVNKCRDSDAFMGLYKMAIGDYDSVEQRDGIVCQAAQTLDLRL